MTTRMPAAILLSAGVMLAASGLTAPTVGFSLDAAGDVRPLLGVRGNLLVNPPVVTGALSAAFWNRRGLAKTDTSLLSLDREGAIITVTPAPAGPAVVGFSAEGRSSIVWFSDQRLLWVQHGNGFQEVPTSFEGEVVGAADGRTATLLVRRENGIWTLKVSKRTGRVRTETPLTQVKEPLLLLPDGRLLYSEDANLVLRDAVGTENRMPMAALITNMQLCGTDGVRLLSPAASLLLRLDGINGSLEFLPEGK